MCTLIGHGVYTLLSTRTIVCLRLYVCFMAVAPYVQCLQCKQTVRFNPDVKKTVYLVLIQESIYLRYRRIVVSRSVRVIAFIIQMTRLIVLL